MNRFDRWVVVGTFGLVMSVVPGSTAWGAQCVGDCSGSGTVTVADVITLVNIALGSADASACPAGLPSGASEVSVADIVMAVNNSLNGCPNGPTSTPTTTGTSTPTNTPPLGVFTSTPTPTATSDHAPTPDPAGAGLASSITDVMIGSDGTIVVTFTLTDGSGIPLTPVLSAAQNSNQGRVRLTIAHIEDYSGGGEFNNPFSRYVNDINLTRPAYDSGGTLSTVDANAGVYRYTFKAKLPEGFDGTRTYSVGMQVDRTFNEQQLSANPVHDVVPAGGTPEVRAATTTAQCNTCHDPLIAHGNRREVRLCLLCHTEAAVDVNGTPFEFRSMIHKLHRGKELPSIVNGPPGSKYEICGSRGCDVFAEKHADGAITGVGFPRAIENCLICHTDGPTATYYRERPSTAACATCHDDVNPSLETTDAGPPGTNHFQERGYADGDCTFCHISDSGKEFDISVLGAHVVPGRSHRLAGLKLEITGITNHAAGATPTISFRITDDQGTALRVLSGLNRVGFTFSGPTTDYTAMIALTAVGGGSSGTVVGPDDTGIFQYTPTTGIPADAKGTWVVGSEARRSVTLTGVDPIQNKTFNEAAVNAVVTFTVDGSTAVVRRAVVEDQLCANCHGEFSKDFSIHGNLRNQTEYCVVCHNPNQSDVSRRQRDPAAVARGDQTQTIDFKVMIHKIHTGEELAQKPYLIYGFGAAPLNYSIVDFSDVLFPGDRRNCVTCHATGTYLLPPFPGTALGTQVAHLDPATGNEVVDGRTPPITSACTSCHDGDDALAHAETQTASSGAEACAVCHEEGRSFAVSILHAGRN